MLLVAGGAGLLAMRSPSRWLPAAAVAVMVAIESAAIVVGLSFGDYHVIGLFGCLSGFAKNPLGYGLGAGGNLAGGLTLAQWQQAQHAGMTDIALESGIGVLLYQMGIGGIALLAVYGWLARVFWQQFVVDRSQFLCIAGFASIALLGNALLQEEALFSPLALASILLLGGVALGQSLRQRPAWQQL
jgi:hypothetical protein